MKSIHVQRADQALSDLTAGTGRLPATTAENFVRLAIGDNALLKACRTINMPGPQHEVPKIDFGGQLFYGASEEGSMAEQAAGERSKADLTGVILNSKLLQGTIAIPYAFLEDNVEHEGFMDTLNAMVAVRAANDIEKLIISGDTASANTLLNRFDGALKRLTANVVDAASAPISGALVAAAQKSIPARFRGDVGKLRFFFHQNVALDWRQAMGSRPTIMGDSAIQATGDNIAAYGPGIVSASGMPVASGILTDPQNLVVGFQRDVRFQLVDKPEWQRMLLVVTTRVAFNIENAAAAAKLTNLGSV